MDDIGPKTTNGREPEVRHTTAEEDIHSILIHRVSWSGVFAGVAIAAVAQLLLNMLGIGFGAGAISQNTMQAPEVGTFSIGAGLWWGISAIIASALGGYAAGRLSGRPEPQTTAWHGLTAWAISTLLMFYLLTTAVGSLAGGAVSALSSVGGSLGNAASTAVGPQTAQTVAAALDPFSSVEQQIGATSNDPAAQRAALIGAMRDLLTGDQAQQAAARERAVQAYAKLQNIPAEQARGQIATYETQYRQTIEQARQTAMRTAVTTSRTVFWTMFSAVVALLLGAIAAWWAGRESAVSPTITDLARRVRMPPRAAP